MLKALIGKKITLLTTFHRLSQDFLLGESYFWLIDFNVGKWICKEKDGVLRLPSTIWPMPGKEKLYLLPGSLLVHEKQIL